MRALVLSVVMLMSAVAVAQTQEKQRPPPPGQPTGPSQPATPVPGYTTGGPAQQGGGGWDYDDWDVPTGFRRQGRLVVVEREQIIERLARMEENLGRAMERADRNNGRDNRELRDALRRVREEMNGLRQDVNNAPDLRVFRRRPSQPQPPPPPPAPVVQPISEGQLQQLLSSIQKESFGDGKLRVLETAVPTQYFLVPQVLKILQRFSFGDDKLDAVRMLWPRVLDRENAHQLYGAFKFEGEKDQLRNIIGR
ncbi:DUF4476 domain-containing protein [Hyalangium gracile]|uniref:DUF4476 domain-containing protein n=1 Tax=Hyalangium gracile TaxID=394092 RepID=UPI001CC98EDB|nr:DUF4476 domain-containing protein [Hyalangium gracile]